MDYPDTYFRILDFNKRFSALLGQDRFIARSDYKCLISEFADIFEFVKTLQSSAILDDYVDKYKLDIQAISYFVEEYENIHNLAVDSPTVRTHNDEFVSNHLYSEKEYLDDILKKCDPNITLDDEQRTVILSEEDHTLVIAGAGAGKTTTIAAKVRYLVEKRAINPEEILVISFTNKAVTELKERINKTLNIPCPISTFHSVGYAILRKNEDNKRKIVGGGYMYNVINDYLKEKVLNKHDIVEKLILFFGSYFSAPYEEDDLAKFFQFVSTADYSTLKSNCNDYIKEIIDRKTQKIQTLRDETVRSMEEVRIANFLYLNNIEYEYEPVYQYHILDANKPYTPDFMIWQDDKVSYIEHFGITEDGRNNRYNESELAKYKARINEKVLLHKKHHTSLIYTFSQFNDGRDILEHLKEQLIEKGYVLSTKSVEDIYKKILKTAEGKYITRFTTLICNFINNFKIQGYKTDHFDTFASETKNVRTKLFLDICKLCYLEYQQSLDETRSIDFEDMINESAEMIRRKKICKEHLKFKYIIVDEYQDISRQRYNLIKELSELCEAKIVAVGDDWQSIYAFSGSVLPLFTRFCNEVGYGQKLKITRTYRNAQELIDIAGTFVQQNASQIRKRLISPKRIENPVIINTYSEEKNPKGKEKGGVYHNMALAINQAIEEILKNYKEKASILFLGRYGFDMKNLCKSEEFKYNENTGKIYSARYGNQVELNYMTAHSSKGLSADNVIIINAVDSIFGFPSKIDDDPILRLVVSNDDSYNYAEERRLFYVALTRTKNRVYIITPQKRPSVFIKELLANPKDYPNVVLRGELKTDITIKDNIKHRCPNCGYPLQKRWSKNYGLQLWICTNDQEICGFMTNDLRGGRLAIQKCDHCRDGYLIVRHGPKGYFIGCTNYKKDGSGCNRSFNEDHYLAWTNDKFGDNYITD